MSEQEKINLFSKLEKGLRLSTINMLERKIKLGENVVIADEQGQPLTISADEALRRFNHLD